MRNHQQPVKVTKTYILSKIVVFRNVSYSCPVLKIVMFKNSCYYKGNLSILDLLHILNRQNESKVGP